MTGDLNFKTLMTLRMPEEGKAGFGLKKFRLSLIFSKTWIEYSQFRNDNIARNQEFLKNLQLRPFHTVTGGDSSTSTYVLHLLDDLIIRDLYRS
jgi:hypothetical protein